MVFELKSIAPWGRSFEEYVSMFSLTPEDLRERVLGCGDGPAGFNAGMAQRGLYAVSCDPLYRFGAEEIRARIGEVFEPMVEQMEKNRDLFIWKRFRTPREAADARLSAMNLFLDDYEAGRRQGRYRDESLPELGFDDGEFDLALCSHLLFLYARKLDYGFHRRAVLEMCRVAREVRVSPLFELEGDSCPYVEPLIEELRAKGFLAGIVPVDYEFRRGENRMLRVVSPGRTAP